jgi:hypothetical protein
MDERRTVRCSDSGAPEIRRSGLRQSGLIAAAALDGCEDMLAVSCADTPVQFGFRGARS